MSVAWDSEITQGVADADLSAFQLSDVSILIVSVFSQISHKNARTSTPG